MFYFVDDIGHRYYGPDTGNRAWESGPIKISSGLVRGLNPGPTKYFDHMNRNLQNIAIAWIVKIPKNTNGQMECIHNIHMEYICWRTDDSQTNGRWPD